MLLKKPQRRLHATDASPRTGERVLLRIALLKVAHHRRLAARLLAQRRNFGLVVDDKEINAGAQFLFHNLRRDGRVPAAGEV